MNEEDEVDLSTLEPFDPAEFDGAASGAEDATAAAPGDVPELADIEVASVDDLPIFETTA